MTEETWFRIGDGALGLTSDDAPLSQRFDQIYGECRIEQPAGMPRIRCRVATIGSAVHASFDDPEPLDIHAFVAAAFPGRDVPFTTSDEGRSIRVAADTEWRPFVANLAVTRLQRLQREVMFFHAASVVVRGRGVMACGPKRSGKTTLALALGARGHGLLGDELAAIRLPSRELLPVRRSVAVRAGPAATAVRAALSAMDAATEVFPDGEPRERATIGSLFPGADATGAPLTLLLLLRTFAPEPLAEPVTPTPELVGQLTPLAASLWRRPAGAVTIQLMRLLSATNVWWLNPGSPERTAGMIEDLVEKA